MLLRQIFDPFLSQYAYLVGCQRTGEALVIDPQRDVERYLSLAEEEGLRLVAATETHIHADFLSGCRELVETHGIEVYLSAEGGTDWSYGWGGEKVRLLRHGESFRLGGIEIQALHTPGHTPEHLSFLIFDRGGGAAEAMGLASGDFVFVGDLGRPDLLESAAGQVGAMEPAAQELFRSARTFLKMPDYLQIWPGHGAGSACGKALGAVPTTTVGYERRFNAALSLVGDGEEAFVSSMLEGQPEPPLYFSRMKHLNRLGPTVLGDLPRPRRLAPGDLAELAAPAPSFVVVDTRLDRGDFMKAHLPGSLYAPWNRSFPTITGSYLDPEQQIFLVAEADDLEEAVRNLVRLGLDRVEGWCTSVDLASFFGNEGARATILRTDFRGLGLMGTEHRVLDVRRGVEFEEGHIPGARNIPHTRLLERLQEVPGEVPVAVHCLSGARAASAASLLERAGREVIYIDDEFARWQGALPLTG